MSRNEIIISCGALCVSAAILMKSDLANALLFLGLFAVFYGVVRAIYNIWM